MIIKSLSQSLIYWRKGPFRIAIGRRYFIAADEFRSGAWIKLGSKNMDLTYQNTGRWRRIRRALGCAC